MPIGPMLTGAIARISTQSTGGWKIVIDAPESMGDVIRQLIGTENQVLYNVSFDRAGDIERIERGPGRPRRQDPE